MKNQSPNHKRNINPSVKKSDLIILEITMKFISTLNINISLNASRHFRKRNNGELEINVPKRMTNMKSI